MFIFLFLNVRFKLRFKQTGLKNKRILEIILNDNRKTAARPENISLNVQNANQK